MISALLLAAIAVLPSDRMAMADRLFNRGRHAEAMSEYRTLQGEPSIADDALQFRMAECELAIGDKAAARTRYRQLAERHPGSEFVPRARLQLALLSDKDERLRQLRALDTDRIAKEQRAAALYHLGVETRDSAVLDRAVAVDPKGVYASAAGFALGALQAESNDPAVSRKGVERLLGFAFGDGAQAEEALYLAAVNCYRVKRYGEAGSLFRRYLRKHSNSARKETAARLAVWCDYLQGRYADAAAACGEGATDDLAYLRAACAWATGDSANAAKYLREYLERFPSGTYRADAELLLARQEFSIATQGTNMIQVVESAERVYGRSKSSTDGLRLGWAYTQIGRLDAAENLYRQLVAANPGTEAAAEALYARAMLAARAEEWAKAELLLAEAMASGKLGERHALAGYWRGVAAIRIGHEAEAASLLKAALADKLPMDEDREARLMVADLDLKAGRNEAAKPAYLKLVAEGACERMSAARLKTVGELLGGEAKATCARELLKSKSAEWRQTGYAMLGASEEEKGAFTAAIEAYRKCLAEPVRTTEAATAALRLGRLELRAGEHDRADSTLRKAVALNAGDAKSRGDAYLALAENAVAKGDIKAACGYATVIVSLFDDAELQAAANRILKAHPEVSQ